MPDAACDPTLLAVDLGLRCGLAAFSRDTTLLWYGSTHFPNRASKKRGLYSILQKLPSLETLVTEGDRELGEMWWKQAKKRGAVRHDHCGAETWRTWWMPPKSRRSGASAKRSAVAWASGLIPLLGAQAPKTPLRHDTAEAILLGLWGLEQRGWLLPERLRELQDALS